MQTVLDSKHIAKDKNIPDYVNECQIDDTVIILYDKYHYFRSSEEIYISIPIIFV